MNKNKQEFCNENSITENQANGDITLNGYLYLIELEKQNKARQEQYSESDKIIKAQAEEIERLKAENKRTNDMLRHRIIKLADAPDMRNGKEKSNKETKITIVNHKYTLSDVRAWPVVDGWSVGPEGEKIRIGSDVWIDSNVWIGRGVWISNNVWINSNVWISSNVTIGYGVTISSGSVLAEDVISQPESEGV